MKLNIGEEFDILLVIYAQICRFFDEATSSQKDGQNQDRLILEICTISNMVPTKYIALLQCKDKGIVDRLRSASNKNIKNKQRFLKTTHLNLQQSFTFQIRKLS